MTQRETSCRLDRSSVARSSLQSTPGFQSIRSAIWSIMRKQTQERSTTLAGYGTAPHLLGEMFRQMTGVDIVHVPYKGAVGGITDLLAGRVQMAFQVVPLMAAHVQAGKLRALGVTDDRRSLMLPDVPTTAESGYPHLQAITWFGVLAPAGTSPEIIASLNTTINRILSSDEMIRALSTFDAIPMPSSPASFAAFIAAERKKWTDIIRRGDIKIE